MTHPITPPPELVQQWANESPMECSGESWAYELFIAHHAAQWGADQQLEQDAKWLGSNALFSDHLTITPSGDALRQVMRPKPPSLKEQALIGLSRIESTGEFFSDGMKDLDTIRCALEQLDD